MFICPVCQTRLYRTRNEIGLYWYCPTCGGRAVTLTFLRRTVVKDYVNTLWLSASHTARKTGKACPACNHRMVEIPVSQNDTSLRLDVCTTCQFIWFDPKEYEQVPAIPAPVTPDSAIPLELRQQFAIAQVKAMGTISDPGPTEWWQLFPAIVGLPVEREVNELQHTPWVTWILAAVLVLVTVITYGNMEQVVYSYGLVPKDWMRLGGLTLLTSFFLHGGIIHMASNVYFLLVFGDNVEDYLGKKRFLFLMGIAALAGSLLHVVFEPRSDIPCVGASSGIAAIITYYALQFPHAQLGFFSRFLYSFTWTRCPAWFFFFLWLTSQIFTTWEQLKGFGSVSALAHIGGITVGVLFWLKWRNT